MHPLHSLRAPLGRDVGTDFTGGSRRRVTTQSTRMAKAKVGSNVLCGMVKANKLSLAERVDSLGSLFWERPLTLSELRGESFADPLESGSQGDALRLVWLWPTLAARIHRSPWQSTMLSNLSAPIELLRNHDGQHQFHIAIWLLQPVQLHFYKSYTQMAWQCSIGHD